MAIDHRIGTKVIKNLRREEASAARVDPYPYIGIVKNNLDPTRSGRLQVWIPDLGGEPDSETSWRTVNYASPFMGYTPQKANETDRPSSANTFDTVPHTYGMWMVPPDIGVEVLVMFVAGDPNRGYWVACVNSNLSHYMVPGLAGDTNVELPEGNNYAASLTAGGVSVPVTEYNEYGQEKQQGFYNNPKPLHKPQYDILKKQGLHLDNVRGSISSSSQRETPSHVFGISTPGRPSGNSGSVDPAQDPNYLSKVGSLNESYYAVKSRRGGHTFVMDDGDTLGNDQLVRLRTAMGHQLMMHDTAETLYIANANGDTWIELTKGGTVNVYGKNGIALRSESSINIHSDSDIVFNAEKNIILRSGNSIKAETTSASLLATQLSIETTGKTEFKVGTMAVEADTTSSTKATKIIQVGLISQSSDPGLAVKNVPPIPLNLLPDTTFNDALGVWVNNSAAKATAVTIMPSHEPHYRGAAVARPDPNAAIRKMANGSQKIEIVSTGPIKMPTDADLRAQPKIRGLGPLTEPEMRAIMSAIATIESKGSGGYTAHNGLGYFGKYQFGAQALQGLGYIKKGLVTSYSRLGAAGHEALMRNPNSWTGKNNINSLDDFLTNQSAQENIMYELLESNYNGLVANGTITQSMTNEEIGGIISIAHNRGLPATTRLIKEKQEIGGDGFGTNPDVFYNAGKSAVLVSAPKIPSIDAG